MAGEYFVAAELSRRGYIATLTLRNARGIDIVVADPDSTRSVGIQVKTSQSQAAACWPARSLRRPSLRETSSSSS